MDLDAAERLARELLTVHGLRGWTFRWNRARQMFGSCNYTECAISLSPHLVAVNDEAVVRDTILHEIAHALVGPDASAHGAAWKAACRRIGAKPKRCYSAADVNIAPAPWIGHCDCDTTRTRVRLDRGMRERSVCVRCASRIWWVRNPAARNPAAHARRRGRHA